MSLTKNLNSQSFNVFKTGQKWFYCWGVKMILCGNVYVAYLGMMVHNDCSLSLSLCVSGGLWLVICSTEPVCTHSKMRLQFTRKSC